MASYFVSTTGDNGDPGTIIDPFATWSAVPGLNPGDNVFYRGGEYLLPEKIEVGDDGASGSPITVQNYNDESVTLDGDSLTLGNTEAPVEILSSEFVVVQGSAVAKLKVINSERDGFACRGSTTNNAKFAHCEVDGATNHGISAYGAKSVNTHNITVEHCKVRNVQNHGINIFNVYGGIVHTHNNDVATWGQAGGNQDAILIHDSPYYVVEYNDQGDIGGSLTGDGIDCGGDQGLQPVTHNHHGVIQHNTAFKSATAGGQMKVNNYAEWCKTRWNKLRGMPMAFYEPGFTNMVAYHNTLLYPQSSQALQLWNSITTFLEFYFYNNVIEFDSTNNGDTYQHAPQDLTDAGIFLDGNVFRMAFNPGNEVDWRHDDVGSPENTWAGVEARPNKSGTDVTEPIIDPNTLIPLSSSPAINGGALPCELTAGVTNGTTLTVNSNRWFVSPEGYNGIIEGDLLQIGNPNVNPLTRVVTLNETDGVTMTVDTPVTASIGAKVWHPWAGSAPDAGAVQASAALGKIMLFVQEAA